MKHAGILLSAVSLFPGCGNAPQPSPSDEFFTPRMREACPTLPDEALASYVAAIDTLRGDGLGEDEALAAWLKGCDSIPPDGNFQGDVAACQSCLQVLVAEVYATEGG